MTLQELQRLLDSARCVQDVLGNDVATNYRLLARICHPDGFPHGSAESEQAESLFKRLGKWKLLAEHPAQRIESPARTYTLVRGLGAGDLCEVSYAVSGGDEYVLKVPRIIGADNLMAKEREVLEQLIEQSCDDLYREYFPRPVESFRIDRRRINAYRWRDGFYTAEHILKRHASGLDGRHLAWMFKRTLVAIGYAHNKGWIHGAVVPPHLMFHAENHGLQLVGWIHAEKPNHPLKVAPVRYKDWYPPECRRGQAATRSVDIYLAAKSLVYLSGGDPLSDEIPERIPAAIRRFIKGCLLESPSMRSQDAWDLHDEFNDLLEGVYGPPKFHRLEMP